MCHLESVGYFSPPETMHQGALSPWDFAAQVANRQSHLILAIAFVIQNFTGSMIRVAIS